MTVNVLGTDYTITVKKFDDDKKFSERALCGYCSGLTKEIVICDMHTYKNWNGGSELEIEQMQKHTLRHEIVHAFFNESGLSHSSVSFGDAWADNEEMVDWIAIQLPKMVKAMQECGAM